MKTYRVGFKWKDSQEDYIVIKSEEHPTQIAKSFKEKDKTGNLETVFVKLIDD